MLAMVSTVKISFLTRIISPKCLLKLGLAGKLHILEFTVLLYSCLLQSFLKPTLIFLLFTPRYTEFGGAIPNRPAEDLAYSVARFIQNRGSFINYYMVSQVFRYFSK